MTTSQLLVIHVLLFSAVPIVLAARPWRLALPLLYSSVAIIALVGGFLAHMYSLPIRSDLVVSSGELAFGALLFTVLVLLFTTKDPQVVRDVVQVMLLVTLFRVVFVLLATASLRADGVVNPFGTSVQVFDQSGRSVVLIGLVHVAELIALVVLCERVKAWRHSVPVHYLWYVVAYVVVIVTDGVLQHLLIPDLPMPDGRTLGGAVRSSLALGVAYAVPVTAYLLVFEDRVQQYEATAFSVRDMVGGRNATLIQEIERQQEALEYQATHDTMTGLANRSEIVRRIDLTLEQLHRSDGGNCLAVLFIDLDDFKLVNDGHGHAAGDAVLIEVGERIRSCLRDGDVAARLGGDEFCVLIADVSDTDTAAAVGYRIMGRLSEPVALEHTTVSVHGSLGLALASDDSMAADVLIRNADLAMYRAKELGKDRIVVYSDELDERARARAELSSEITRGVDAGEFVAHYQPVVDLGTGRVVAVEALMRWYHPRRGVLSPAEFIAQAEGGPTIITMGEQVLRQACADSVSWAPRGGSPLPVSVNVSTRQLRDPGFVLKVAGALQRSGLPAELLTLEVTESSLMSDVHASVRTIEQLKALGVVISIDDFGTGFSSLAYLHQLPVDALKIDKSFVDRVCDTEVPNGAPLVRSIIGLGELLDLTVVAEGVETEPQREALVAMGCRLGQGFHFSEPVPGAEVDRLLGTDRRNGHRTTVDRPVLPRPHPRR